MIYSLNTKNEEQEATLQSLRRVATETQASLQPTTGQDEEEEESASILRTRLLELQATVEEVKTKMITHTHVFCKWTHYEHIKYNMERITSLS